MIQQITCDTAKAYGVEAVVTFQKRYGPTINHAAQAEFARQQWQQISPKVDFNVLPAMPLMASEDFSDYLKVVPGAFALIGTGEAGKSSPPCHSAQYDFNDKVTSVIAWFSALVGLEDRADKASQQR